MSPRRTGPILTLEPLIEAVQDGVEAAGWALSGLQKTTSHQFEGRWAGDATRSAYLFFHEPDSEQPASIDVYLDETTRGLGGNLALVVDLRPLAGLPPVAETLGRLGALASAALPEGYRTPVTLRFRLGDGPDDPGSATTEARFKLRIPTTALEAGPAAVSALASAAVSSYQILLGSDELRRILDPD
ncbi:MAG: hypothetical protein RH859_01550 [Longimicrobiales bacterium]